MYKLSITEALVSIMADRDDLDATNAAQALRFALEHVRVANHIAGDIELKVEEQPIDRVDSQIIMATRNGQVDIFKVNPFPLYTVFAKFPGGEIEEVDAHGRTSMEARSAAEDELDENFAEGWEIIKVERREGLFI